MKAFRFACKKMGSAFEFIICASKPEEAEHLYQLAVKEITRIEHKLSEFDPESVVSGINRNAGIKPVETDAELTGLINRSLQISKLTGGAFDITMGPLKQLYDFKNSRIEFPEQKKITEMLNLVGYDKLFLDQHTHQVMLQKPGMRISFAAIGKGYAADRVKSIWKDAGITGGVISASGDMCALGINERGEPWKIGIAHPDNRDEILYHLPLSNASIATSGDYEQYFLHKGIRYSHNINPCSGMPVFGIKSVSVISPGAELSDALATAVYVMGVKTGLEFVNQLPDTHCLIIDAENRTHHSRQLHIKHEK